MGKGKLTQMPLCDYGASCTRKGCVYRHPKKPDKPAKEVVCEPVREVSTEVCKPFLAGICQFGKRCYNRHPGDEEAHELIAKYYKIACKWGDDCRSEGCLFNHPSDNYGDGTWDPNAQYGVEYGGEYNGDYGGEYGDYGNGGQDAFGGWSEMSQALQYDENGQPLPLQPRGVENQPNFGDDQEWTPLPGANMAAAHQGGWQPDADADEWTPLPGAAQVGWQPDADADEWTPLPTAALVADTYQPDANAASWQPPGLQLAPAAEHINLPGFQPPANDEWTPLPTASLLPPQQQQQPPPGLNGGTVPQQPPPQLNGASAPAYPALSASNPPAMPNGASNSWNNLPDLSAGNHTWPPAQQEAYPPQANLDFLHQQQQQQQQAAAWGAANGILNGGSPMTKPLPGFEPQPQLPGADLWGGASSSEPLPPLPNLDFLQQQLAPPLQPQAPPPEYKPSGAWAAIANQAPSKEAPQQQQTNTITTAARAGIGGAGPKGVVRMPQDLWLSGVQRIDASQAFNIADPLERFKAVNAPHEKRAASGLSLPRTLSAGDQPRGPRPQSNTVGVIDLHFQSVRTAAACLDELLPNYLRMHCEVWLVTGTGHHTDKASHQKSTAGGVLHNSVSAYLQEGGYLFYSGKDTMGHSGALLVVPRG